MADDVSATFTATCYECDPPKTVQYRDGQRVPSDCPHEQPAVDVLLSECVISGWRKTDG